MNPSIEEHSIEAWNSELRYKKERPLDRALLVIHNGKALYLDHIGPGIEYYLSECTHKDDEFIEPNGVYIWEGKLISKVITYFEGDHDCEEELNGTLRLATLDEWQAYINDEYIWDRSEWLLPDEAT
jgi:hypothetical protein